MSDPSLQACAKVCQITNTQVLTADEMMELVSDKPACIPLCEQLQTSQTYVSREGVGFVQQDSFPRAALVVVSPEMGGRVVVPGTRA